CLESGKRQNPKLLPRASGPHHPTPPSPSPAAAPIHIRQAFLHAPLALPPPHCALPRPLLQGPGHHAFLRHIPLLAPSRTSAPPARTPASPSPRRSASPCSPRPRSTEVPGPRARLGMAAASEDADGDRFIEVVSAGALYRGGEWERKYWSCTRGKDRYPYPVGYQTVRHFSGISYAMEIQEGPRGPVFLVTSTEGGSATGPTPDIAWKNFQKKSGAKIRNWQRRRSFPQKIDGAEACPDFAASITSHFIFSGSKTASVRRLLRELIVDSTGAAVLNLPCPVTSDATLPSTTKDALNMPFPVSAASPSTMDALNLPCPVISDAASPSTTKDAADVCDAEDLHICLNETGGTAKRSIKPSQIESAAKRVHYQDIFTSADNHCESVRGSADEGGSAWLRDVSDTRCPPPLLEEVPDNSKHSTVDNVGETPPCSSQQGDSPSGSYLGSEKSGLESAEKELALSTMSILRPQAITLRKRSNKEKKSKHKKNEKINASVRKASAHIPSDDCCKGVTVPTTIGKETNKNSSETNVLGESFCDMVKDGCANDDCTNNDSAFKLDEIKVVVEDSFEDDDHIWGYNRSKPRGVHHHESDDACSRDLNENPKVLDDKVEGHPEPTECQFGVHDSPKPPDVVYDHEKGQYILSDSLLACLEEEFGGEDMSYPANSNQCHSNVEQMQVEEQFKDPDTNCMKDGSSVSLDVSCHRDNETGLVDVCAQAQCRIGNGNIMMPVECESNLYEHMPPKGEHIACHHPPDQGYRYTETPARGSDHHLEFVGCYQHPMPVLSIMLNTRNHGILYVCVLCGSLDSCQRVLYVYTITPKDQQDAPPCFVGHTPLLLPSLEQSSTGNFSFGRSGLQLTHDGQFLVLLSSIRIPLCRMKSIDCSCYECKSGRCEDNSLKIVSVNSGYVSLKTKLMTYGMVSCILMCEPNYIVAAEDCRNLHVWKMVTGWSRISEEYVIPSLGHVGPSILELRRMPKSSSLIIGHDGSGGFCLWDISKRSLLSTFAAPGNIVFQILPVGFCSLQEDIIHASVGDIEKRLQEITVSDMSRQNDRESILIPQREDIAVWVLVSSASVAEYQHDLRAKEYNARWRLALLAKKRILMGNILDSRATAVDTSGNYGFAGTYGGLLYMWEVSSGRKLAHTRCINRGRVSCIAVDAESGAVAVGDDRCQLLLYTQNVRRDG
ncbi:hypothetical protein EJB05_44270, partial [Eragrostis curvula]